MISNEAIQHQLLIEIRSAKHDIRDYTKAIKQLREAIDNRYKQFKELDNGEK